MTKKVLFLALFLFGFTFCTLKSQINTPGSFSHQGITRNFWVHLPSGWTQGQQYPLVIVFHGLGDSGQGIMNGTGFNFIADTAGFIAVYPDAVDQVFGFIGWNNGTIPFAQYDDVNFTSSLIDTINVHYGVNLNRVYATGFSMGSIMSHHLACNLSNRIAAIAGIAGPLSENTAASCNPGRHVPVMHQHGTSDQTITYTGGTSFVLPVDTTIDLWTGWHDCPIPATYTALPDIKPDGFTVETFSYAPCTGNSEVLLYKVTGADHQWLFNNNDINTGAEIWKFFAKYDLSTGAVGIDPLMELHNAIEYSPNPFRDYLKLKVDGEKISEVSLYDLTGKNIGSQMSVSPTTSGAWSKLNIETADLSAGLYLLKVSGSAGTIFIKVQRND